MFPWQIAYLAAIAEQREMAFLAWQRSGYSDLQAHATYLRCRQICMAR